MKKKYGTKRGSHEIIIKRINDTTTQMAKALMACKIISICWKEEVSTRFVTNVAQCTNKTMPS